MYSRVVKLMTNMSVRHTFRNCSLIIILFYYLDFLRYFCMLLDKVSRLRLVHKGEILYPFKNLSFKDALLCT